MEPPDSPKHGHKRKCLLLSCNAAALCRCKVHPSGPRARGHLIEISDRMFGWYVLVGQSLAFMKMPLLSVPSGEQVTGQRSK